jgi:putative peptide zinc metalloprotease protein
VWTGDGLGAGEPLPRVHADPVTDAYELVEEPRDATPPDGDASEEDPRRRGRRVGRADAAYPPRPAGRSRRMPLAVALTSVAAHAALVIVLQLAPSDTPDAGSTAGRAPSLPRVEFVGLDSSETPSLPATGADLRLATTPAPVESLVATPLSPPGAAPADSGRATPPADSLGRNPGR